MLRYELNVEDMADIDEALELASDPVDASSNSLIFAHRIRDLRQRFRNAHVVYIETEEGL